MKSLIEFPAWHGELGWEVMSWVPGCRKVAQGKKNVKASSFAESRYLYEDFVTEFVAVEARSRSLNYPKVYRPDGLYLRYGDPMKAVMTADVLIHARGIRRKSSINYTQWTEIARLTANNGLSTAFIGTMDDYAVPGYPDFRGIGMEQLCDRIAAAGIVTGVSSGVMHLAAACGTDLVVWGDGRTYFGETLEQRYKITWNPFDVRVGWITADNWQPEPERIIDKIKLLLRRTERDPPLRDLLRDAI